MQLPQPPSAKIFKTNPELFPHKKPWEIESNDQPDTASELLRHDFNLPKTTTIKDILGDVDMDPPEFDEPDFSNEENYLLGAQQMPIDSYDGDNSTNKTPSNSKKSTYRNNSNKRKTKHYKIDDYDASDGQYDSENAHLYLMNGSFTSFTDIDAFPREVFDRIIYSYQMALQPEFRFDLDKVANTEKMKAYVRTVIRGLELYSFLTSTIDYAKLNNVSGNRGLLYIRGKLNADDIYDLSVLKEVLENQYLNPNLVNYIKNMYGNYATNLADNSPIIKLCPDNLFLDDPQNSDYFRSGITIRSIIMQLKGYHYLATVFNKLNSNWKINLADFNSKKRLDSNFLTFWHNTAINYAPFSTDKMIVSTRNVKTVNDDIYLGKFINTVKGEYIASISIKDSTQVKFATGLFVPTVNYPTSMNYYNRVSLHVYTTLYGVKGIKTENDAVSSFNYNTPYIDDKGNRILIVNKSQTNEISHPNLNSLRKFTEQCLFNFLAI